jgi:hypothetical protein
MIRGYLFIGLKRGSELWLGYTLTLYAQLSGDIVQRRRAAYNAIAGGVPIDEVIAMHMISLPIMAQSFLRGDDPGSNDVKTGALHGFGHSGLIQLQAKAKRGSSQALATPPSVCVTSSEEGWRCPLRRPERTAPSVELSNERA